ncbi:MAG TPA: endonuclease/exonuclease/phosphatase family protein [Ohtaekwangia sp.]|nr:endonuclease/exonuclease/phosphatase family protein [Ohtaekwangia sp.]
MLRIITLNLNYYVEKHGAWEMRKELILTELEKSDPDIIAFQAVARHPILYGGKDQALQIAASLKGYTFHTFHEAQSQPDGLQQGNAVISKLPVSEINSLSLSLFPDLSDDNNRIVQQITFDRSGKLLNFYNAHFSWVKAQAIQNAEQATQLIANQQPELAILAGDLNTPPDSNVFESFNKAGFVDAWQMLHGNKAGHTFESDNPSSRIDYFWVSSSLTRLVRKVEVISSPPGDARLSDHLGVMIELDI